MKNSILICIYIVLGVIVAFADKNAFVLYITVLPLNFMLLKVALRKKIMVYSLFMILIFIGMGIDPIMFFLRKETIQDIHVVIGSFDFTLNSFFSAYSYFFVFTITLIACMEFFVSSRNEGRVQGYLIKEAKKVVFDREYINHADTYIYIIVFFATILTVWMYVNTIGLIGLKSTTPLPFHLNGILYYFRRFLITFLLIFLYVKSENKTGPQICLILYATIAGVTASSRSLPVLLLFPIAAIEYMYKRKAKAIFIVVFVIIVYGFVSSSRVYTYASTKVIMGFIEVMQNSFDDLLLLFDSEMFFNMIAQIFDRTGGCRMMVLTDQFSLTSFSDLMYFYAGGSINNIVDVPGTIMGIEFDSDYAFGTGLQFTGTMTLLTNHNYLFAIMQGLFVSIIILLLDKVGRSITNLRLNGYIKLLVIASTLYMTYVMWTAEISKIYVFLVLCFLYVSFSKKSVRNQINNYYSR